MTYDEFMSLDEAGKKQIFDRYLSKASGLDSNYLNRLSGLVDVVPPGTLTGWFKDKHGKDHYEDDYDDPQFDIEYYGESDNYPGKSKIRGAHVRLKDAYLHNMIDDDPVTRDRILNDDANYYDIDEPFSTFRGYAPQKSADYVMQDLGNALFGDYNVPSWKIKALPDDKVKAALVELIKKYRDEDEGFNNLVGKLLTKKDTYAKALEAWKNKQKDASNKADNDDTPTMNKNIADALSDIKY